MVRGYEKGKKVRGSKKARIAEGLRRVASGAKKARETAGKAGAKIREGAQKVQDARYKFYEETYPDWQRKIGAAQESIPSVSELLGFEGPTESASTKKKKPLRSRSVRAIIFEEEDEEEE